jgi:predicted ribosome quality control (RQC) complex YloA/Tae2 family protein
LLAFGNSTEKSLKYFQFVRLLEEIMPRLEGARVQKIYQPGDYCVQIELYTGKETEYLTVRNRPGLVSLYLSPERSGPKGAAASDLSIKLRSRLSGAVCIKASRVEGDRILELAFSPSPGGSFLVIELFGIGANMYLLDETRKVAAVLDHKAAVSRGMAAGREYIAPDPPPQLQSQKNDEKDPVGALMERENLDSYNAAAGRYYESLAAGDSLERYRSGIRKELNRELKRLEKLVAEQRKNLDNDKKAAWNRECGEILAANFRNIRRGQYQVRLPDFYTAGGELRVIPLDESMTPQQNVERYFKKSRKLENAAAFARKSLKQHLPEIEKIRGHLEQLDKAEDSESVAAVADAAGIVIPSGGDKTTKKKSRARHQPYRRFAAIDGSEILVGKGGRDNDELTFRIARGRDMWFHVSGAAGSHVVLRSDGDEVNSEALLDAASLAVQYSSVKHEERAEVDYTRVKHVSRPPRSAPGLVVMADRKTVRIKVDRSRLNRLHKNRPAS